MRSIALTISVVGAEGAIFTPLLHPEAPNTIQQALVLFTGTQQNHWTIGNMLPYYGSYLLPLLTPYVQRAACGRDGEKILKNGTKDYILRYIPVINALCRFFYMPGATSKLIKDIETECEQLGIANNITRGSLPDNENYLLLLRPGNYRLPGTGKIALAFVVFKLMTLVKILYYECFSINKTKFQNTILKPAKQKCSGPQFQAEACIAAVLILASRYFFYFNRYIIPYETIEKLSPELQEQCYDLMWLHK